MKRIVLLFLGVWIVAVPIFLLFGADPKDIFNIFIASIIAILIFAIYTNIRNKSRR